MKFSRSTHLQMFLYLETLTFIIRTGLPILVEPINLVNSVIIFPSQMTLLRSQIFNFPNQIPDCDSHSPARLDLFISSNASICFTMAFPPLANSDHVVVSVSIDFPSSLQWNALFHCIAYDCSRADWDGLCDHLKDILW